MTPPPYNSSNIGVLLTNVGSPAAPTPAALRRYLRQFLGDRRIVELPTWWWRPLLELTILPFRPGRIAPLYRNIWRGREAPLVEVSRAQAAGLEALLSTQFGAMIRVVAGMRYGEPSIPRALDTLKDAGCDRILVLPLFPQYSATTSGSNLDAIFEHLARWRRIPALRTVAQYHDHPAYLDALVALIRSHWQQYGRPTRLLISFHGIPLPYVQRGDPYRDQCLTTARSLARQLDLGDQEWGIGFQSRLGPVEWLAPYTDEVLCQWGRERLARVDVVCPGFSTDCLETTDEIGREGKHQYQGAGGGDFHYIPALNAEPVHLAALATILRQELTGWLPAA